MKPSKRYGLIGKSLKHSFSPTYFRNKFDQLELPYRYEAIELSDISEVIHVLNGPTTYHGLNVTVPYKQAIIPYLDALDPNAEAVGAVNTVAFDGDKTIGYNTDIIGVEKTLSALQRSIRRALVLGTGGASKAVQYALSQQSIVFDLVSRDARSGDLSYDQLQPSALAQYELIINTTPLGMYPDVAQMPPIPFEGLTPQHVLFDLIYNPQETAFLKQGASRGARTVNGLAMLHAQAEASWEIWNR